MTDIQIVKIVEQGPQGAPAPGDVLALVQGEIDAATVAVAAYRTDAVLARNAAQTAQHASERAQQTAEFARDAAQADAKMYASVGAGLAATSDGGQFIVPSSDGERNIRYERVDASTATELTDYPTSAPVIAMQRRVPVTRSLMGVAPLLIANGRVLGWLGEDGVRFHGLDGTKSYAEPRRSPLASNLPIMTDGRSLHRWRGAIAKLKAGVAGVKPRMVLTGDSWMELNPLPVALRDRIALDYTMAGWGWWYAIPGSRFSNPGAGYVRSANWTFVDASAGTALTYGTGPDGNLATTTLNTETLTFNNLVTTGIKIYTREWGGTWRYRVDGGSWTTVSEVNTDGRLKITTISGLPSASHVIDIDTTGNTGRVAFAGYMIAGADTGVEVLRMGNGASRGIHLTAWSPFIADIGTDIAPDLVVVSLGTNDYRYSDGVAAYIQGLRDLRDSWRAAVPNIGFVFMSPPLSGGTVVTPQSQFRDALYEFCITEGHEFFNGTDDWPAYSVSNAQGLWDDSLHPNAAGATAMVNRLYRNMLGL